MSELLKNKKIMLVVAHPDDELLGLGSTVNRMATEWNCKVHVVILGEGITSRSDQRDPEIWEAQLEEHRRNIYAAKEEIGYHSVSIYSFPDNRFDTVARLDVIKIIEKEKSQFIPDIIFTHHLGDVNIDHQITFESVITACRPMQHEYVKTIICFETPSGTEWRAATDPRHFIPNYFVEINKSNLLAKVKGMECYEFEKRSYPHPRSAKALEIQAQRWGQSIGAEMAEAFVIVRHLEK